MMRFKQSMVHLHQAYKNVQAGLLIHLLIILLVFRSIIVQLEAVKELENPIKGFISIQNIDDNECFKWCLVRYLNPADHQPRRIGKADKDFPKTIDFKDINFLVKTIDIHKIENKKCIGISVFGYENQEKYPIYVKNNVVKKNILTYYCLENQKKITMFLSKNFNRFMYVHLLLRGRRHFYRYCLRAFII